VSHENSGRGRGDGGGIDWRGAALLGGAAMVDQRSGPRSEMRVARATKFSGLE